MNELTKRLIKKARVILSAAANEINILNEAADNKQAAKITAATRNISRLINDLGAVVYDLNRAGVILDNNELAPALKTVFGLSDDINGINTAKKIINQFGGDFASLNLLFVIANNSGIKSLIDKYCLTPARFLFYQKNIDIYLETIRTQTAGDKTNNISIFISGIINELINIGLYFGLDFTMLVIQDKTNNKQGV